MVGMGGNSGYGHWWSLKDAMKRIHKAVMKVCLDGASTPWQNNIEDTINITCTKRLKNIRW